MERASGIRPFASSRIHFGEEGEDFDGYCRRVELSADWGGELAP